MTDRFLSHTTHSSSFNRVPNFSSVYHWVHPSESESWSEWSGLSGLWKSRSEHLIVLQWYLWQKKKLIFSDTMMSGSTSTDEGETIEVSVGVVSCCVRGKVSYRIAGIAESAGHRGPAPQHRRAVAVEELVLPVEQANDTWVVIALVDSPSVDMLTLCIWNLTSIRTGFYISESRYANDSKGCSH